MYNKADFKLTTAKFAELHNINKRTLHYYDKIGLFEPQDVGENKYRYYNLSQSIELENILMLRELGMSIEELSDYIKAPNEDKFIQIADTKVEEINQEMERLQYMKKLLLLKKGQVEVSKKVDKCEMKVVDCDEMYLLITPFIMSNNASSLETLMFHLKQAWEFSQYKIGCGTYVSVDKLRNTDSPKYDGFFTPLPQKVDSKSCFKLPAGKYIYGYVKGEWKHISVLYEEIFAYVDDNFLEMLGPAFEIGINEFAISNADEYVTQVMVMVKEKKKQT